MKRFFWFIAVCLLGISSCVSGPDPLPEEPAPVIQPEPVAPAAPAPVVAEPAAPEPVAPEPVAPPSPEPEIPPVEASFDFSNVTEEVFKHTEVDIQQLIANLNEIIRRKDYQGWVSNLDESYFAEKNSRAYLDGISNNAVFKRQNIVLRTARDYFNYVVVPSRTNDHVDRIDIDSEREVVKAYQNTSDGRQQLLLYELKNVDGAWKIAN
jgi:hypothetical protein